MKRIKHILGLCLLGLVLPMTGQAQVFPEKEKTTLALNWEGFMKGQNMLWNVLPTKRSEAPFMGNGKLGLMVYKDPDANALLFATGHAEATNHLKDATILGGELLPTGNFILTPAGKILKGQMELDLWNAETTTEIWTDRGKIKIISFVHADEQIIINRITTEGDEPQPEWNWKPAAQEESTSKQKEYKRRFVRSNVYPEGGISTFKSPSGGETAALWYLSRQKEANTLYITINHAYPDTVATELGKSEFRMVLRKGFNRVRHAHRNWWHDFYSASFVTLPDAMIENFYWAQMYKMGSSMREDGLGIIHGEPYAVYKQWPNRLWNFNVHSIYMPINGTNHNELALPLENAFYNAAEEDADTTRTWKKILGRLSRKGNKTQPPAVDEKDIENGQLVWACQNLWAIYRHKMDDNLLRYKLYPLLREATNRYIDQLHEESDGHYHLTTFYHHGKDTVTDNNFDLAMLRWGCQTMLSMSRRLQIEDPQITLWQRILKRLTPLKTHNGVLLANQNRPEVPLHLLSIYPLYTLNIEVERNKPLIHKSITDWVKKNEKSAGFPFVTASSLYATERNGTEALKQLQQMIRKQVLCNSMTKTDNYTPGLAGAQAILNMLMQSWNGIIRIFPALPPEWQNIAFYHLRTEGAFLISAQKVNGKTTFVEVTDTAGELCTIELDFDNPTFDTSRRIRITRIGDRTYNIPIRKGESVRIYPRKSQPDFEIHAIGNNMGRYFGKKQ